MGVKVTLSQRRRNIGWGYWRTGRWGTHAVQREARWQGSGEDYITRSLMVCTPDQILLG